MVLARVCKPSVFEVETMLAGKRVLPVEVEAQLNSDSARFTDESGDGQ